MRRPLWPLILLPFLVLAALDPASGQLSYTSDKYHTFDEMTAFLREANQKYPDLTKLYSIGKSYQGRDLWLLEITNRKKGNPDEKPGLYIDGCIDSSEVVTTEGVLFTIKRLLEGYGKDPDITEIVDTRTLYLVPRLMPDNTELYITTPQRADSVSAEPMDEDDDTRKDEDPDDDVNADGHVVQMRVKDPNGEWKVSEKDPRLMIRRRPGELEGTFYRVLSEGMDDDKDGKYNEDGVGGVDPNRNFPGNWMPAFVQSGAGPYPLYVQEVRAVVEFLEKRSNLAGYVNHHSSGGVVLRPSTAHDDSTIDAKDLKTLRVIGAMILDATGYWLATSVYDWRYPPGTPDTKPGQTWRKPDGALANDPRGSAEEQSYSSFGPASVARERAERKDGLDPMSERGPGKGYHAYGGTIEFTYELLGIISYASEQWRCAFDNDLDKNGEVSDLERLSWNDKHFGGSLFINWTPFTHPQLGDVEIGGWKKYTTSSPPPGRYLEQESERQFQFNMVVAKVLPRVVVREAKAEPLGGDLYKVVAKIDNAGYIPTSTERAKTLKRARCVTATVSGDGLEVLDPKAEVCVGHIDGSPSKPAEAKWIVRTKAPSRLTVTAYAPTAGRDSKSVQVGK